MCVRDQINEISFELRMETILILIIFAVVLRYLSSNLKGDLCDSGVVLHRELPGQLEAGHYVGQ